MTGQAAIDGWNSFDIPNIDVTVGQTYGIYLNASTTTSQWSYKDSNTYVNGKAFWDTTADNNKDFGFKTFGIGEEPTLVDTGIDTNGSTGIDASTNYGAAPSATTVEIKAPTELKAVNSPTKDKPAVTLTWKKSATEDVTKYSAKKLEKIMAKSSKLKKP